MTRITQLELEFFTTQELCMNAHWTNARNNFKPNVRVNDRASLPANFISYYTSFRMMLLK